MNFELKTAYRKGVRWSLAGSLVSSFFQFVKIAVFARLAGPESTGAYALAATFLSFLTPVAEAGLSQSVVQAAQIHPRQLSTLAWINWTLGALIFLALWLSGPVLANWFAFEELPGLLLLMGASLLITPFGAQYAGLLARELQFGQSASIEIWSWCLSFFSTICLALLNWGAWAMAAGFLIRNLTATLGCIWFGHKILPLNLLKISPLKKVYPLLRFGFFELSSRWADFFSNYLDKLIIAKWLGPTALGYYHLAFTFLMLPTARIGYVITRVTFPLYARIKDDKLALQGFFERSAREIILLLYPIYLAMILFPDEIILICFGAQWLAAAPLFVALGIAGLIRSLCAPFPQMVKGLGKPQWWLVWTLLFSAVLGAFLLLFLWIEPSVGAAAWSRTTAKVLGEIGLLWLLAKWCGLEFGQVLRFALKVMLLLIPTALLVWLSDFYIQAFWVKLLTKSIIFGMGIFLTYRLSDLWETCLQLLEMFGNKKSTTT